MMNRDDYKAIKHMDKAHMEQYLQRIYQRGFEAGVKAIASEMKNSIPADTTKAGATDTAS